MDCTHPADRQWDIEAVGRTGGFDPESKPILPRCSKARDGNTGSEMGKIYLYG